MGRFFGTIIHVNYRFRVGTRPTTVQTPILPWKVFYAKQLTPNQKSCWVRLWSLYFRKANICPMCNKFAMVGICGPHAPRVICVPVFLTVASAWQLILVQIISECGGRCSAINVNARRNAKAGTDWGAWRTCTRGIPGNKAASHAW